MVDQSAHAIEHYAKGLDFAADVAHAEARWQTELAMRGSGASGAADVVHTYGAERASQVEAAIRGVARSVRPHVSPRPGEPTT